MSSGKDSDSMATQQSDLFDSSSYVEETAKGKLARKFEESPFMVFGIIGCIGAVGYGAYSFRARKIRPSIFLMQLRVAAQGAVVGCLCIGAGYSLFQRLQKNSLETNPPAQPAAAIEDKKKSL